MSSTSNSINASPAEVEKFSELAAQWWDPQGPSRPLHVINPTRLAFVQQQVDLAGKTVLDVGCGGGILSESLARAGAHVTAIDLSEPALQIAREHAKQHNLSIDYQLTTIEQLAEKQPQTFDVITCMEMLEHVPDPTSVIQACSQLVKPEGDLFFSTINRNAKSYAFAILGAEYLFNLLPKGTHDYQQFIKPAELARWLRANHCTLHSIRGIAYNPLNHDSYLTEKPTVNYIVHAKLN